MELRDKRIYVQLEPDDAGREALVRVQDGLEPQRSGRRLPPEELHLTLIHFGKTADVLAALRTAADPSEAAYTAALEEYVDRTRALLTDDEYDLQPLGFGRFGAHGTTLVVRYDAPAELHEVHAEAYVELTRFIGACGIMNADEFARSDPNFRYARELNPHVTLYKGYDGSDPDTTLAPLSVRFMKLVY